MANLPKEIAPFLQSCWAENPDVRPDFTEITKYLKNLRENLWPMETSPPKVMEIEDAKGNAGEESMGTTHVINNSDEKAKNKKNKRSSPCFFLCSSGCSSD